MNYSVKTFKYLYRKLTIVSGIVSTRCGFAIVTVGITVVGFYI